MKAKSVLLTVLLLLMSTALGWFLPSGIAAILDKKTESNIQTEKIEPINLSYSQNLTISDKLQAMHDSQFFGGEQLQSGIFLKKDEAEQITKQFFADFWGQLAAEDTKTYSPSFEDIKPYATPVMVKNSQGNGLVVWEVAIDSIPPGSGYVVIDDATGVILSFYLFSDTIALLEPEQTALEEYSAAFINHFLSAYNQHLQTQNAALTCQCTGESPDTFNQYYPLTLTSPDGSAVSSSLRIYYNTGEITFNQGSEFRESLP